MLETHRRLGAAGSARPPAAITAALVGRTPSIVTGGQATEILMTDLAAALIAPSILRAAARDRVVHTARPILSARVQRADVLIITHRVLRRSRHASPGSVTGIPHGARIAVRTIRALLRRIKNATRFRVT